MASLYDILQTETGETPGRRHFEVGDDWGQGRAIYGGLVSTLAVKVMRDQIGAEAPPLRSLQVTFAGPVLVGTVVVEAKIVRAGKSVTVVEARVGNGADVGTMVTAAFAGPRQSPIAFPIAANPQNGDPEKMLRFPYIKGITPEFTRHCQMAIAQGTLPFQGAPEPRGVTYIRWPDLGPVDDELALVLAGDTIPPPVLSTLKAPRPASSLMWTFEITGPVPNLADQWLRMDAAADHTENGYSHHQAILHGPDGAVLAIGRQVASYF